MKAILAPFFVILGLAVAGLALPSRAAPAHDHGVARLDVGVEPQRIVLLLDTPLDNLLGFERAPRTDAERQQAAAAVARLRDAAALFRIDPAAGCTPAKVELVAPALGLGPAAMPGSDSHADLEGQFEFRCTAGAKAGFVEVRLFEAFAGFKRLDLQLATPRGQMQATLRRPQSRVALAR